jgi:seryl-tRNA synthetase
MLDKELIRSQTSYVHDALLKKGWDVDFTEFLQLSEIRKTLIKRIEDVRSEANKLSASVPLAKKNNEDVTLIFAAVKKLSASIKVDEEELKKVDTTIDDFIATLPNLPDPDLLPGEKENNKVIQVVNKLPEFAFAIKNHVDLCTDLKLIDYERAAKISGTGTWVYTGIGAQLEWALLNFFISEHLRDGFKMILPPHILNYESGYTAGQFPKFSEDVFWLKGFDKFILPTAETALVNYHRNEILKLEDLPLKYFAYTPCYRKEAGSYRTDERGMIRGYQFNKVEMFIYSDAQNSDSSFELLVGKAVSLVEKLGLHFQVSKLAAGDCSHSMARTYDIEVWIPSMGIYKEVSSVSNAREYQARRGMIRYKDKDNKTQYAHTLNASGLATSRLIPAIVEQFQNADGSVNVPEVLQPFLGGLKVIK